MEHEAAYPATLDAAWIQTFSGTKFHFFGDDRGEIDIEALARGLAQTCRWRGQYKREIPFFCVAQHSVHAWKLAPVHAKKFALMHDAAEWILGDMAKPVKQFLPDYKKLEGAILHRICSRFNVPRSPRIINTVKTIDNWLLFAEAEQFLVNPALIDEWDCPRLDCKWAPDNMKFKPWSMDEAEARFIAAFKKTWKV